MTACSPVEADLNRESARQDECERIERMISDADVHDAIVEGLCKRIGARAVRWLRGPDKTYEMWMQLGTNLSEMQLDMGRLVEILTDCFACGEDIDRELSDFMDAAWSAARARLVAEKAREE